MSKNNTSTREIKFRAWNKLSREMYSYMDEMCISSIGKGAMMYDCIDGVHDYLDEIELMQFTGLKDKNDKEIYEGDIVVFRYYDRCTNFVVLFYDGGFVQEHCDKLNPADYEETKTIWYGWDEVEVVGNVHENPEMLGWDLE